mgnify:CR=1 FL=1|jgi:hypothetical protein|nr:MAG TPA: hypothetical protein [Caudoviricetes sp.]
MNYSKMSEKELNELHFYLLSHEKFNAATEVSDFKKVYGKRVRVIKGRKVPHGTEGVVFFVKRYDNSKYGDPWGIYSTTRIGLKDDNGDAFFTAIDNVIVL